MGLVFPVGRFILLIYLKIKKGSWPGLLRGLLRALSLVFGASPSHTNAFSLGRGMGLLADQPMPSFAYPVRTPPKQALDVLGLWLTARGRMRCTDSPAVTPRLACPAHRRPLLTTVLGQGMHQTETPLSMTVFFLWIERLVLFECVRLFVVEEVTCMTLLGVAVTPS